MRFCTSDLHLGHAAMARPDGGLCGRPWADVEAMNAGLLQRWNAVVGGDDEVFILGDLTLKNPAPNGQPTPWLTDWLAAANGTKTLILGNHDKGWKDGTLRAGWYELYQALGFEAIHIALYHVPIGGHSVTLSHLPLTITEDENVESWLYDRTVPSPHDHSRWRLHGHVHTRWQQLGREVNVGVDAWNGYPVPEDLIARVLEIGPMSIPARPWAE